MRAVQPCEGRGKAQGVGGTTKGDVMTKRQYQLAALAGLQYALLMMRLGVRMK
jgi:hypothetical protein